MKNINQFLRVAVMLLAMAPAASWAVSISVSGAGSAVADNTTETFTVNVADDLIITGMSVDMNMASSTWVGDMIVTLTGPGGESIDIMNSVGAPGNVGAGDSSDLNGDYSFADGGADLWAAADAALGGDVIAPGTYSASGDGGVFTSFADIFNGTMSAGDWTLSVTDDAGGDATSFGGWTLNIEGDSVAAVPEPSTLLLIGAGILGFQISRRRK